MSQLILSNPSGGERNGEVMVKGCEVSVTQDKYILEIDPAITLLDICPKDLKAETQTDICILMFIAA